MAIAVLVPGIIWQTPAHAQSDASSAALDDVVDVIAIEYPPYIGSNLEGFGPVYQQFAAYAEQNFKVRTRPEFLPPARATLELLGSDWCVSIFPADGSKQPFFFVSLLEDPIQLGLYRKRKPGLTDPFRWESLDELAGSTVALLRTNLDSSFLRGLTDAGIEPIFVDSRYQGFQMLLAERVDFVQGTSVETDAFPNITDKEVEFSRSYTLEYDRGFYYHLSCAEKLFKDGNIPHLNTPEDTDPLVQ